MFTSVNSGNRAKNVVTVTVMIIPKEKKGPPFDGPQRGLDSVHVSNCERIADCYARQSSKQEHVKV